MPPPIKKERLAYYLLKANKITIHVALSSSGDENENIFSGELNDFVFNPERNTLELWSNTDYEI